MSLADIPDGDDNKIPWSKCRLELIVNSTPKLSERVDAVCSGGRILLREDGWEGRCMLNTNNVEISTYPGARKNLGCSLQGNWRPKRLGTWTLNQYPRSNCFVRPARRRVVHALDDPSNPPSAHGPENSPTSEGRNTRERTSVDVASRSEARVSSRTLLPNSFKPPQSI